ncbi:MAG: flippase-like domain-containing protein [Nitrospirae bacterium]|nr:flippase-like domain-containing protein [Nitrospirota bacterium]
MKHFKRIAGFLMIVIVFYFIGRVVYEQWDKISGYPWSLNSLWLGISIGILLAAYLLSAYEWTLILRMIGVRIELSKGISIFLLSMFGRYIPGGIWSPVGRVFLCRREGIADSRSGMSVLLEQTYPVVSAAFVFVVSLLFWHDTGPVARAFPLLVFVPLFFIFLHPKPFLRVMNPVLAWFGKGPINISLSFGNMLILAGYYSFSWIVAGVAFYCFIRAFYPLEFYYIPILSGISAISFIIGYLTFFTPAGLGVREGSITILLSLFIPTHIALGVALLSRLWIIGVELIILIIFLINAETRRMVRSALGW